MCICSIGIFKAVYTVYMIKAWLNHQSDFFSSAPNCANKVPSYSWCATRVDTSLLRAYFSVKRLDILPYILYPELDGEGEDRLSNMRGKQGDCATGVF